VFWTRYSHLLAGGFVLATVIEAVRYGAVLGIWDAVNWLMCLICLVGLFAYVHGRRVWSPGFWAVFVPASLIWTVAYEVWLGNPIVMRGSASSRLPEDLLASVLVLPLYLALFRYAYGSSQPPVHRPA
jgi:hypothetical protein